jgi:hypothetical protein
MSMDKKFGDAVTLFNALGAGTTDSITATYQNNQNILIERYDSVEDGEGRRVCSYFGTGISAITMVTGAHNAWTAPDWETAKQEMPVVSLGLTLVFATLMWKSMNKAVNTTEAVEREVQNDQRIKEQLKM